MEGRKGRERERNQETQVPEVRLCTLCQSKHTHMTAPSSWKDERAKSLARELNITADGIVCRACRDDISRVVKDPGHTPRWEEKEQMNCSMPGCGEVVFAKSNIITEEQLNSMATRLGLCCGKFHLPAPLCKTHYNLAYREMQPVQTTCVTCGVYIGKTSPRVCPNPRYVQWHLADLTGFEGDIKEGDRVCHQCYKSHLCIVRVKSKESRDEDLIDLISELNSTTTVPVTDIIQRAMHETSVYVAKTLLKQEALILPSVHEYFTLLVQQHVTRGNLQGGEEHVTARWILSNLIVTLGCHLSYVCKIRRCGTLLYRTNGDVLTALTVALHKGTTDNNVNLTESDQRNTMSLTDSDQEDIASSAQRVMDDMNSRIHKQISKILNRNKMMLHKLDIDREIADMDKTLWTFIASITRSPAERRGSSRVMDSDFSASHVKNIRRFYCLCCLYLSVLPTPRPSSPFHHIRR